MGQLEAVVGIRFSLQAEPRGRPAGTALQRFSRMQQDHPADTHGTNTTATSGTRAGQSQLIFGLSQKQDVHAQIRTCLLEAESAPPPPSPPDVHCWGGKHKDSASASVARVM